jgi:AraC-like DNA-binding protein
MSMKKPPATKTSPPAKKRSSTNASQPSPAALLKENHEQANIVPNTARSLLRIAEERGHDPKHLCRGLGFRYQDLVSRELSLSYQQIRRLILRVLQKVGEPALGIAAGACQSPVSWGLPGLIMLTCRTLGEAAQCSLQYQIQAGALFEYRLVEESSVMHIEVIPKKFDEPLAAYLIEESLAGVLAVARYLVGDGLRPLRVELTFASAGHEAACERYFKCPVKFGGGRNRITLDSRWLNAPLRGYDPVICLLLQKQLVTLLTNPAGQHELLESVANQLRFNMGESTAQPQLARTVNMSERTLRRRLQAQAVNYRSLRDSTRYERAKDLLSHTQQSITAIAATIGYTDVRSFRRAFQRWADMLPTEFRKANL